MTAATLPIPDSVEAHNDTFALEHDIDAYYDRASPLIRFIERRRLSAIREMLDIQPGERLLEVGCGGGHVLRLFPQATRTGVDVSGRMIEKARRNLDDPSVRLLKGELQEVGLHDGEFDAVICTEVLEHTVNPRAVLAEIRRVLHPKGRVVVTFPNDHLIHAVKSLLRRSGLWRLPLFGRVAWGGDEYHLHLWKPAEMTALLERHFGVLQSHFVPVRAFPIRCCFLVAPVQPAANPVRANGPRVPPRPDSVIGT